MRAARRRGQQAKLAGSIQRRLLLLLLVPAAATMSATNRTRRQLDRPTTTVAIGQTVAEPSRETRYPLIDVAGKMIRYPIFRFIMTRIVECNRIGNNSVSLPYLVVNKGKCCNLTMIGRCTPSYRLQLAEV